MTYKLSVQYLPNKKYKIPEGTSLMVDETGVYLISNEKLDEDELAKIEKGMERKNKKGGK